MPEAQENFQKLIKSLLDIVIFESWLRFYFITETKEGGAENLRIELPEKSLAKIRELYPQFYPMAEKMNGKTVDFEVSRKAVLNHISEELDGKIAEKGETQKALQSATFQTRLNLFHIWEQLHEAQLDQGFADFGSWLELFGKWLATPAAQNMEKNMLAEKK